MAANVAPAGSAQDVDRPFSKWAMAAGHLTKSFPGVRALDDVSVSIYAGEIAALLGKIDAHPGHVRLPPRGQLLGTDRARRERLSSRRHGRSGAGGGGPCPSGGQR